MKNSKEEKSETLFNNLVDDNYAKEKYLKKAIKEIQKLETEVKQLKQEIEQLKNNL